jgi:hypothetical protein
MIIKIIKFLIRFQSRYVIAVFDMKNLPSVGDTIKVGGLVAEFNERKEFNEVEYLIHKSYKRWCNILAKYLGIDKIYSISEGKNEVEYKGVWYNKNEILNDKRSS